MAIVLDDVGAMQHGEIKLTTLDVKPLGPDAAREIVQDQGR
jgi:hypothetical protein